MPSYAWGFGRSLGMLKGKHEARLDGIESVQAHERALLS